MCAHIGQNRDIYPPRIFRIHFDSWHPPPIPQVDGGGCYREKFFLILFFRFSYSISTRILFFYFFKTLLQLVKFSLGIPYQLLSFLVLYSFDYDFEFTSYRWELWLRYNFSISYFRFWISTCFSIVYSTLYLLNSLSLWLFCLL